MENSILTNPLIVSAVLLCVLLGAVALLAAAGIGRMILISRKMVRSEFKQKFLGQRKLRASLVALTVVFALLFAGSYRVYSRTSARAIITLNYSEASKGQNANGTRYNMAEIICDEVVERAISKGALEGVTTAQLKNCLTVEPLVQGDPGDKSTYHIATEFLLTYQADRHTAHLDAENVVNLVASAYKEFYIDQYAYDFRMLDLKLDQDLLDSMDYLDAVDYLENQAYIVENYMYELMNEMPGFVSSDGNTFGALAGKVKTLTEVQIQSGLKAYLLDNGISKDTESYISRLEYDNKQTDYERQRASASYQVRLEAIDKYVEEMTRIVLVPTWDNEGEYYMGRTKVGIDSLSVEAEESSRTAAGLFEEIETNRAVIAALEPSAPGARNETADRLIANISSTLLKYAEEARSVGQEYSETRMNGCIYASIRGASGIRMLVLTGVAAVLFFVGADLCMMASGVSKDLGYSRSRLPESRREDGGKKRDGER